MTCQPNMVISHLDLSAGHLGLKVESLGSLVSAT